MINTQSFKNSLTLSECNSNLLIAEGNIKSIDEKLLQLRHNIASYVLSDSSIHE